MSRYVNEIVETIPENVFDAFKHHVVQHHITPIEKGNFSMISIEIAFSFV